MERLRTVLQLDNPIRAARQQQKNRFRTPLQSNSVQRASETSLHDFRVDAGVNQSLRVFRLVVGRGSMKRPSKRPVGLASIFVRGRQVFQLLRVSVSSRSVERSGGRQMRNDRNRTQSVRQCSQLARLIAKFEYPNLGTILQFGRPRRHGRCPRST